MDANKICESRIVPAPTRWDPTETATAYDSLRVGERLLLGLGAIVGETTADVVHQAMETCRIKHVSVWCDQHLGTTLASKRRIAYAADKKSDEHQAPSS